MKSFQIWVAILLGVVFVGLTILYWVTPAGSLPSYVPGFIAGSSVIHVKHGLASLILSLALFAFAWFTSGNNQRTTSTSDANTPASVQ
jgi:hypothetical protein